MSKEVKNTNGTPIYRNYKHPEEPRNIFAFWWLGLLCCCTIYIVRASAKYILSGGVGLVYICMTLPPTLLKFSLFYWLHKFSYNCRMITSTLFMMFSFTIIALSSSLPIQLIGVCFASPGLSVSSIVSLASFYDNKKSLSAWSSGTGFAGIVGFGWLIILHHLLKVTFKNTLLLANIFGVAYFVFYFCVLLPPKSSGTVTESLSDSTQQTLTVDDLIDDESQHLLMKEDIDRNCNCGCDGDLTLCYYHFDWKQKSKYVLSLLIYMIPIIIYYTFTFCLQVGVWSTIGFPITNDDARKEFYGYSNWFFLAGTCIARSSGTLFETSLLGLWLFSFTEIIFCILFIFIAIYHFWFNYTLLIPCFFAGLFGGIVFVNTFTMIGKVIPEGPWKELALTVVSFSTSLGGLIGSFLGLFLQSCLYKANDLSGAYVSCPL